MLINKLTVQVLITRETSRILFILLPSTISKFMCLLYTPKKKDYDYSAKEKKHTDANLISLPFQSS